MIFAIVLSTKVVSKIIIIAFSSSFSSTFLLPIPLAEYLWSWRWCGLDPSNSTFSLLSRASDEKWCRMGNGTLSRQPFLLHHLFPRLLPRRGIKNIWRKKWLWCLPEISTQLPLLFYAMTLQSDGQKIFCVVCIGIKLYKLWTLLILGLFITIQQKCHTT